ncbi:MAG: hypothetical protein WCY64_03775 [Candidatus Cloacimonadaceae bacterium]
MRINDLVIHTYPTDPKLNNIENAEILVRNFVSQYRRPFSAETISSYTGIPNSQLRPIIDQLISDQLVKVVSSDPEQIYVKNNRYIGIYEKTHDNNRWNFDQDKAMSLLEEVETNKHRNVRTIAKAIGKSRQWVYVYLEALASIGAIEKVDGYYKMISKERVRAIGSFIMKGILQTQTDKILSESQQDTYTLEKKR